MRTSRLLSILIQLQLRGSATAEALAREFEVSVRTIYRDIERLGASGVPVYADRGPGGGFRLLDGYRTRLTGLETDEAEALYMIGLPGPAEALGIGDAAGRAGRKMLAALPASRGELAGKLGDCFHLDPVYWYRAESPPEHLPAIARAVLAGHGLSMTYDSWTGVRDWSVRPFGLVLKAGHWYLVAEGHGKRRIFKVSNIRAHALDGSTFERPRDFDLAAWWSAETARFEAELRRESASLQVTAPGMKRIAALGAYAQAAVDAAIATDREGWMRIELPIEHIEQAALLLLGIGPEVRVLAPEALCLRLGELARAVAGLCDDVRA